MKSRRNPWASLSVGTPIGTTSHNIYLRAVQDAVPLSVRGPRTAISPSPRHISVTSKSWEPFAHGITHPQAPTPVRLHPSRFLLGEQRIRDVAVLVENGVVVAWRHPEIVRRRCNA
jgi:hypothetical protein